MTENTYLSDAEASGPPHPALRGDAERNRKRLLEVAATVFAEEGFEVSMDQIARAADLGKGTLFRHFPTKECLIGAIAASRLHELLTRSTGLSEATDPAWAMREFMRIAIELVADDKALLEALHGLGTVDPEVGEAKNQVLDRVSGLLERAQEAGGIRRDLTACDIMLFISAIGRIALPFRDLDPDLWTRYLDIVFDGFAVGQHRSLPHPPPTREQMSECMHQAAHAFRARLHSQREA